MRQSSQEVEFPFDPAECFFGRSEEADVAQTPCIEAWLEYEAVPQGARKRRKKKGGDHTEIACDTSTQVSKKRSTGYQDRCDDENHQGRYPRRNLLAQNSIDKTLVLQVKELGSLK